MGALVQLKPFLEKLPVTAFTVTDKLGNIHLITLIIIHFNLKSPYLGNYKLCSEHRGLFPLQWKCNFRTRAWSEDNEKIKSPSPK